jgi:hypothetical protein
MEVGGYSMVGKNLLLVWWVVPSSCLVKEINFRTKVAAFHHSTSKKNIACLMPWVNQHPHHLKTKNAQIVFWLFLNITNVYCK